MCNHVNYILSVLLYPFPVNFKGFNYALLYVVGLKKSKGYKKYSWKRYSHVVILFLEIVIYFWQVYNQDMKTTTVTLCFPPPTGIQRHTVLESGGY